LSKRFHTLTIVIAVLLVPSVIFAGVQHKFAVSKAVAKDNAVVVPLVVTNEAHLVAIDIPLKFSEGVTLRKVDFDFEESKVSYFDLKVGNINNTERTVVIGLLPQLTPNYKPPLDAGENRIANLVFEVNDPSVTEIKIETIELKNPDHFLTFVYHDFDQNGIPHIRMESPEFEPVTVALSGLSQSGGPEVPDVFALNQNYPNPFNPTTEISFALPVASHVDLTIYNVLGQKVETLVDREMEAGFHTVTWNADPYSTGVYFYRISANEFTETKKMIMLK
jgi:hypothetical protein